MKRWTKVANYVQITEGSRNQWQRRWFDGKLQRNEIKSKTKNNRQTRATTTTKNELKMWLCSYNYLLKSENNNNGNNNHVNNNQGAKENFEKWNSSFSFRPLHTHTHTLKSIAHRFFLFYFILFFASNTMYWSIDVQTHKKKTFSIVYWTLMCFWFSFFTFFLCNGVVCFCSLLIKVNVRLS